MAGVTMLLLDSLPSVSQQFKTLRFTVASSPSLLPRRRQPQ
jgi:hypothetical protein